MRIGIDARLWNETGVGRYIRNLVWELANLDKENEYVVFVKKGIRNQELGIRAKNWKVVETGVHWHSIDEQLKFPQILYKENLDLVHFPYFSHPVFYDKPFVVTIHDLIITHVSTGKASTLPYPLYALKRIGYDIVVNHAIRKSHKIIVPLNAVKEDVVQTFNVSEDKVAVTYEGASSLRSASWRRSNLNSKEIASSSTTPRNDNYFLYVGNAYPHKNLEFLINAFVDFRKKMRKDVQLVLVGKDDYFYKRLKEKIKEERLAGIIFKHNVSDEELFALYAHAIALVSASRMEGFGLPPLEAMSASCLLLLSDIPSFREVCKDVAFYFDVRDRDSLTEKMRFVYNLEHRIREKKINAGLERVKDFSWKKMAEETLKMYESCISL